MPDELITTQKFKIADLPRRHSEAYREVYANNVGSSAGYYDLRFIFGQLMAGPSEPEPHILDQISVTMSWEHALQFRDLMTKLINGYERDHGQIRTSKPDTSEEKSTRK